MAVLHVEDRRDWSTMVSGGWDVILSMWVGRDPRLRPEVQAAGCCQDLWRTLSEMDDLHSLSSAAFSFFGLEFTGKLECMDEWLGLPRSRYLSLRRSGHDAGFVCDQNPLLLWHCMWTLFLLGM